ncbi:MAG: hypothetical protein K2W78_04535 [Xanthobacteraceae bacterium]|nr:hypothetical protein [Xanthobacteraceae bacterium]
MEQRRFLQLSARTTSGWLAAPASVKVPNSVWQWFNRSLGGVSIIEDKDRLGQR